MPLQTIGSARIANNAVTTVKISDYAITNTKLANSTVTVENISADTLPNYDLDDVSYLADGNTLNFPLRFNTSNVSVKDPSNLMVIVNGAIQKPYANTYGSNTWITNVYSPDGGYMLDSDGTIRFSEPVPNGSVIQIRVVPGIANTVQRTYPYRPIDIMVGD
jgi:hypothetical protein